MHEDLCHDLAALVRPKHLFVQQYLFFTNSRFCSSTHVMRSNIQSALCQHENDNSAVQQIRSTCQFPSAEVNDHPFTSEDFGGDFSW